MATPDDLLSDPEYRHNDEDVVNWAHIRESVALAMDAEGIDDDITETVLSTVDDALANHSQSLLLWSDIRNLRSGQQDVK